jgi:hypothetical protein
MRAPSLICIAAAQRAFSGDFPPFPRCDSRYNAPCSFANAEKAVTAVLATMDLAGVTAGTYNPTDAQGFEPFVLENGAFVAHGSDASVIGKTLEEYLSAAAIPQPGVAAAWSNAATDPNGRWVTFVGPSYGESKHRIAYVEAKNGKVVGAAFDDVPLPLKLGGCSTGFNDKCSITASRRLVGQGLSLTMVADDAADLAKAWYEVTFTRDQLHVDSGFYIFAYAFGAGTKGECVAHGAKSAFVGKNLTEILAFVGNKAVDGEELHDKFVAAALNGGGWVDYAWKNNPEADPFYKIAFITGVRRFGINYYVGVGFTHKPKPSRAGPGCSACSAKYSLPCSIANTFTLISHVQAQALTATPKAQLWDMLSADQVVPDGFKIDGGFYDFSYDFNGTCTSHANPLNRGLTLWGILDRVKIPPEAVDGHELHQKFVDAAEMGGGWVNYGWRNSPDEAAYDKVAFIIKVSKYGREFYSGVGYTRALYSIDTACSAGFVAPCSESNALALLGHLQAAVNNAQTKEDLDAYFNDLSPFSSANGFDPWVLDTAGVFKANPDATWIGRSLGDVFTSIGYRFATEADFRATYEDAADSGVIWFQYVWQDGDEPVPMKGAAVRADYAPLDGSERASFYLIMPLRDTEQPPLCGNCGENQHCETQFGLDVCVCDDGYAPDLSPVDPTSECTAAQAMAMTCSVQTSECAPGTVALASGECSACPAGAYMDEAGAVAAITACKSCAAGTFSSSGSAACDACSPGFFSEKGSSDCVPCEPGHYAAEEGSAACTACTIRHYQPESGQPSCLECAGGKTTRYPGAVPISECLCHEGAFWDRANDRCLPCKNGAYCAGGTTLPVVYEGHFAEYLCGSELCHDGHAMMNAETLDQQEEAHASGIYDAHAQAFSNFYVYMCANDAVCPGRSVSLEGQFKLDGHATKAEMRVGFPLTDSCPADREGVGCARCIVGMYGAPDAECSDCEGSASGVLNVFGMILGPFVMLGMYHVTKPTRGRQRMLNAFILASLCGLVVFFLQTLSVLNNVNIGWPKELDWIFALARILMFDFSGLTFACWSGNGFLARYMSALLAPVVLCFMTFLAFLGSRAHTSLQMDPLITFSTAGMLFTALYVTMVKQIVTYFECLPNPDPDTPKTLQLFRDVTCGSDEHHEALVPMVFGFLIYIVGFYVVNAKLAYDAPQKWTDHRYRQLSRFLVSRWRPDYWWWGLTVLSRNAIVAVSGLISEDVRVQLIGIIVLVVAYSILTAICQPWQVPRLNHFEIVVTLLIGTIGLFGLVFQSAASEKAILMRFEDAWVQQRIEATEEERVKFANVMLALVALFFMLFAGLTIWCLSLLSGKQIEKTLKESIARGQKLFGEVRQATESTDFLLLVEAVILHGTEYDRKRFEELLLKLHCVSFTDSGQLEDAYIRPPAKSAATEMKAASAAPSKVAV